MQINRLFEIVYLLLAQRDSNKKITAKEMAEKFEVSVRTIYRDVEILSSAGIPIYMLKGRGGGIGLLENFVLNKSVLTEDEQADILGALQGLSIMNVPEVKPVLAKMGRMFSKNSIDWIKVDFSPWGSDPQEQLKFNLVKQAILTTRLIQFSYFNFYGEKSCRRVEPLQIVFKDKGWYLKCFCLVKKDFRTFKIMRMAEVELLDETFVAKQVPPEKFCIYDGQLSGAEGYTESTKIRKEVDIMTNNGKQTKNFLDYQVVLLPAKTVVGLRACTGNNDPAAMDKIGGLWQDFFTKGYYQAIKSKRNDYSLGIYTDYAGENGAKYNVIVGCEVAELVQLPQDTVIQTIPAGKYARFVIEGDVQKDVAAFWHSLPSLNLHRVFQCDFEEYLGTEGEDDNAQAENATIAIYVGIV